MIDDAKATTLVLGEVLIDLFSGPVDRSAWGMRLFPFEGVPGGAPCNVAANLAARGVPVSLITSFADDPLGYELKEMLAAAASIFPTVAPILIPVSRRDGDLAAQWRARVSPLSPRQLSGKAHS